MVDHTPLFRAHPHTPNVRRPEDTTLRSVNPGVRDAARTAALDSR
jgi:hypothetical protein